MSNIDELKNPLFLYTKDRNVRRIKAYRLLAQKYKISEDDVGKIFTDGADWAKMECENLVFNQK